MGGSLCDLQLLKVVDFTQPINSRVNTVISAHARQDGLINSVRISARAHLADGLILGATNSLNGDKIIPVEPYEVREGQEVRAHVAYQMGGGLA